MERRELCGPRALHGLYDPLLRQEHWTRQSQERAALALNSKGAMALVQWVLQLWVTLMMQAASARYYSRRRVKPQLLAAGWSAQWEEERARLA